jgi:hypothetical protein
MPDRRARKPATSSRASSAAAWVRQVLGESGKGRALSLDRSSHPTGKKITDKQLAAVQLGPHKFHGEWNYTVTGLQPTLPA